MLSPIFGVVVFVILTYHSGIGGQREYICPTGYNISVYGTRIFASFVQNPPLNIRQNGSFVWTGIERTSDGSLRIMPQNTRANHTNVVDGVVGSVGACGVVLTDDISTIYMVDCEFREAHDLCYKIDDDVTLNRAKGCTLRFHVDVTEEAKRNSHVCTNMCHKKTQCLGVSFFPNSSCIIYFAVESITVMSKLAMSRQVCSCLTSATQKSLMRNLIVYAYNDTVYNVDYCKFTETFLNPNKASDGAVNSSTTSDATNPANSSPVVSSTDGFSTTSNATNPTNSSPVVSSTDIFSTTSDATNPANSSPLVSSIVTSGTTSNINLNQGLFITAESTIRTEPPTATQIECATTPLYTETQWLTKTITIHVSTTISSYAIADCSVTIPVRETTEPPAEVAPNSDCACPNRSTNQTNKEKEIFIERILSNITLITRTNSTRFLRSKISVADPRPSSRNIGIVGALLLVSVAVTVVLSDMPALIKDISAVFRNFKYRCTNR